MEKAEKKEAETELMTEDQRGQQYIPGAEQAVIKPLYEAMKRHQSLKDEFSVARNALVEAKESLMEEAHQFESDFIELGNGDKVYVANGLKCILSKQKEKIQTEEVDE